MEFTLPVILVVLGLGLAAGIVAGFVGVGGGVVMVPVLLEVFRRWGVPADSIVQAAMATSLTVAVFSVTSSIVRHHRQRRIMWRLVPYLVPGAMAGGWAAARIATQVPGRSLQLVLAGLMTLAAVRMLTEQRVRERDTKTIRWWQGVLAGMAVGAAAGLSGLAGGFVLVPALALLLHVPAPWLAGTSSAVVIFSSLAAVAGYLTATPPSVLGPGFVGYVGLPLSGLLAASGRPVAASKKTISASKSAIPRP